MTSHESDRPLSDDELLAVVGAVLDEDEPLPPGAVEFATGALVWRDVDGELAELLHDSGAEEAVVLRDETVLRLLVFQAGDVTLDVEHGPGRLLGAVSPPGRYRVEVQRSGTAPGEAVSFLTDEAGMFEVERDLRGTVRFVLADPRGRVAILSPWVRL